MDDDDVYADDVTAEDVAAEEEEASVMMEAADAWQHFLDYVDLVQSPWAQGPEDTDNYRKLRAVQLYNAGACAPLACALCPRVLISALSLCPRGCAGAKVANDLYRLKPTLKSWVPHIMVFIVPRQVLPLGDPSRRSCDACESFGARFKKLIKERTCRRGIKHERTIHNGKGRKSWDTKYLKGYIQQSFERLNVSERLSHGENNAAHLQRSDYRRITTGKDKNRWKKWQDEVESDETSPLRPRDMRASLEAVLQSETGETGSSSAGAV